MRAPYFERPKAMNAIRVHARRSGGRLWVGALLALAVLPAGCSKDRLLGVNDPNVLLPSQVTSKDGLPADFAGALSDFQLSYSGSGGGPLTEGMINISGLFSDEFSISETFPDRIDIDRHTIDVANAPQLTLNFRTLQRARVSTERAAADYEQFDANNPLHAQALALAGYTYIMFGENFCSGVPFSQLDPNGIDLHFGDPQTTTQIYDRAIADFTEAQGVSGATATEKNLAALGQARALLGEGKFAEAAAAAATVPTSFVYKIHHSSTTNRENNGVWSFGRSIGRWTIGDREGVNGLPFRSAADVRTPFAQDSSGGVGVKGFDHTTPLYYSMKYATRDSSAVLAWGGEARLIEAEAALSTGDAATWLGKLNDLRATVGLTPLTDPGTASGRIALHFSERAMWLQLTAHRLGDMRREVKYFGMPITSVYEQGPHPKGGIWGTQVVLPIPFDEVNNPQFKQCLDTGV